MRPRKPFFENAQWKVTRYGIECRAPRYNIRTDTLGNLRGALLEWPLHMADKHWVDSRLFCEAFRAALAFHHIEFNAAALNASCARAIATNDYIRRHSAACDRIAEAENIGTKVDGVRIYDLRGLHRVCVLANAELAAAGIPLPERERA